MTILGLDLHDAAAILGAPLAIVVGVVIAIVLEIVERRKAKRRQS